MKSQKIITIALVLAILCGCGKGSLTDQPGKTGDLSVGGSSDTETGNDSTNACNASFPGKELNDEYTVISNPGAGESGHVLYKPEPEALLKLVQKSGEEIITCDNMPSPLSVSPDGKMIAYLSPYEWEVLSDVFIPGYHPVYG